MPATTIGFGDGEALTGVVGFIAGVFAGQAVASELPVFLSGFSLD